MQAFKICCIVITTVDILVLPYLIRNRRAVRALYRKWFRDEERFDGRWMKTE